MSASIDEIWASMNEGNAMPETKFPKQPGKSKSNKAKTPGEPKKKKASKSKKEISSIDEGAAAEKMLESAVTMTAVSTKHTPEIISYADMTTKLARDIQACGDNDLQIRKTALSRIHKTLFVDFSMSDDDYCEVFRDDCKHIFKRFADPAEKCRELAQKITCSFFERCSDLAPVLSYYFPALIQRLPGGAAYDAEMKVFVSNLEDHEAFRRGRAVERQDKTGAVSGSVGVQVVEPSEEIRLLACKALKSLIERVRAINACPILHPYFEEIIVYTQTQLRDPFPDLKMLACELLILLANVEDFEPGMNYYAVGLVRSVLPVLRHRHARVRCVAVSALHACMVVPDRAKRKAAGSEAITDLCGFREENVLPIAAFYTSDVQINFLAELADDKSIIVREEVVKMLTTLLTEIGDRYDHQTRLLPYLLDLLTDEVESIAKAALVCLQKCGTEYELEHEDEVRDRRQYGVDGDDRINLTKPLPAPFYSERPRIGMRLYVRGNSRRFLTALVNELTNWVSHTRVKSANLLKIMVVLCEEHLTMDAHTLFPLFIKALRLSRDDKDTALHTALLQVYELLGRYIAPEVYIYFILPRLRGDADVVAFGVDAETRVTVMEFLEALLQGSKPALITPHFDEIVCALTDPFVINTDSVRLQQSATRVLVTVFNAMKGKGNAVVESHFVATGRLASLQTSIRRCFKFLLQQLSNAELMTAATEGLEALSALESDRHFIENSSTNSNCTNTTTTTNRGESVGVLHLYKQHTWALFKDLKEEYEVDSDWSAVAADHLLLTRLVQTPTCSLQHDALCLRQLIFFLTALVFDTSGNSSSGTSGNSNTTVVVPQLSHDTENEFLASIADLMHHTIQSTTVYNNKHNTAIGRQGGDESACSDHNGDHDNGGAVSTTECVSGQVYDTMCDNLDLLIAAFISDARWSRTATLQQHRLSFLLLLLSTPATTTTTDGSGSGKNTSYLLDGFRLLRKLSRIANAVLPTALQPSQPASLRSTALVITANVLSKLQIYCECTKLKSANFFRQTWLLGAAAEQSTAAGHLRYLRLMAGKLSAQQVLGCLLYALDDANDAVRVQCVQLITQYASLLVLVPEEMAFIREMIPQQGSKPTGCNDDEERAGAGGSEETENETENETRVSLSDLILTSRAVLDAEPVNSFDETLRLLLNKSAVAMNINTVIPAGETSSSSTKSTAASFEFLEYMNDALRVICVLDPARFEQAVRDAVDSMLAVQDSDDAAAGRDRVGEFVSGLINHADVLQQLA